MRGWLLLLLLSGCSGQPAILPGGIVSNNPCIDAVLAEIAAPRQIAAVSVYSHDADSASAPLAWARKLPALGTGAEEIIAAKPRLVLTGNLASSGTNAALARAGVTTLGFGVAATVADDIAQVRQIAKAIGRAAAGERLVARMSEQILPKSKIWGGGVHRSAAKVDDGGASNVSGPSVTPPLKLRRATSPSLQDREDKVTAIIWQNGGFVAGEGTLQDELLGLHGFANASKTYGLKSWDVLPLETLIRNPPDVIFMPTTAKGEDAKHLSARMRLLQRAGAETRIVAFPDKLLFCGGPTSIKVSRIFSQARAAVQ